MDLLDSLKRFACDAHKQAPGKGGGKTPNSDSAGGSEGVQEITVRTAAGPSNALPPRRQKRRRTDTDNQNPSLREHGQEATATAVAVSSLSLLPHVAGPSHSSNTLPQGSASDQTFPSPCTQIVTLRHGLLESHLGSFVWERLLSRQEHLVSQVTSIPGEAAGAAYLHIPTDQSSDFMLELPVTSDAGASVARALQSSFEALADPLGRTIVEGVRNSNVHTAAMQVLPREDGNFTITCFLDFLTGRMMLYSCL